MNFRTIQGFFLILFSARSDGFTALNSFRRSGYFAALCSALEQWLRTRGEAECGSRHLSLI
jgi:hypothetical protein